MEDQELTQASSNSLPRENKNPGALAGATGVELEASELHRKGYSAASASASAQALKGNWSRVRWEWKRAVKADPHLTKTAKLIAVTLVDDFANHVTGFCNPFISTLCEATGDAERTVQKALSDLEHYGWIRSCKGRGRGRASQITFTAEPKIAAEIAKLGARSLDSEPAEQAQPYAPATQEKVQRRAPINPEKVQENALIRAEKVQHQTRKGAPSCGSHIEPISNQKGRGSSGGVSARPVCNSQSVAHFETEFGKEKAREWDQWLAARGWPTLGEFGVLSSDAEGRGWFIPFRRPPGPHNQIENKIAKRYFVWALEQLDKRAAA